MLTGKNKAVLFITAIFPGSLLPPSLYALIRGVIAIFISPAVGRYIDLNDRLKVVRTSIRKHSMYTSYDCIQINLIMATAVGQRLPVAVSCFGFWLLISGQVISNPGRACTLSVLMLLACLERVCFIMNTVSG